MQGNGTILYVRNADGTLAPVKDINDKLRVSSIRANVDPSTKFNTDSLFYPFTDIVSSGENVMMPIETPTKLPEKTDIKVSAVSSENGIIVTVLRGWLEIAD